MSSRLETILNWTAAATATATATATSIKRKLDDIHGDSDDSDDDSSSVKDCLFHSCTRTLKDRFTPAASTSLSPKHTPQRSPSSAADAKLSSSLTRLQFFVRMLSESKTLVIHADPSDTVTKIHEKIQSITRIPITEQRLIYRGKQLQCEHTLAECDIQNDAGLQLVGRMRSTEHPKAWHCVDNMVSQIFNLYKAGYPHSAFPTVKSRLVEFLSKIPEDFEHQSPAYLRIFLSSSAPAALVMLYLSPSKSNRDCADDCIQHFIQTCKSFSKKPVYGQMALIVLEFCKLLGRGAGIEDPLYNICRSCLGSMVQYIGIGGKETKMSRGILAVREIFPFLCELAAKLSHDLGSSMESSTVMGPALGDVRDFVAFSFPIRNSIYPEVAVGGAIACVGGEYNVQSYADETKFLNAIFGDLLGKMDLCLKKMEEHLVAVEKGKCEHPVLGWCQYLTILKELDSISKLYKGAEEIFWWHMRQRKVALCYLILRFAKRGDDNKWISDHKEVTDFEARRHLAMMLMPEVKDEYEELHEMLIDRSQLLAESFEYIANTDPDSLRGGLFMEFKNEEATGPGVLREWFFLVCQEIFNPQNALFVACPNDRRRFFPNPASKVDPLHLDYFKFCGRVIALALMHKVQVGIVFDRVFVLQLAGKTVSLEDILDADPYLYSSCKQILEMDPDAVDQDVLGLTFVREVEELGSRKVLELCHGGQSIVVNSKNRKQYVDLLIKHRFVTSIADQIKKFAEGFSAIISCQSSQISFFQILNPEDLDWMLRGSESAISVEDWKAHTDYYDYQETDPQISWFWKIVGQMSAEQRNVLLFFWTSIKHLPIEGFGGLASRLYICRTLESKDRLPSSHTCFYRLCFPPYPSMSLMRDRLFVITQEHVGCSFGIW